MSNRLGKDIPEGAVVIMSSGRYGGPEGGRLFRVAGGFGTSACTSGSVVFGEWVKSGERGRVDGHDIESAPSICFWKSIKKSFEGSAEQAEQKCLICSGFLEHCPQYRKEDSVKAGA